MESFSDQVMTPVVKELSILLLCLLITLCHHFVSTKFVIIKLGDGREGDDQVRVMYEELTSINSMGSDQDSSLHFYD